MKNLRIKALTFFLGAVFTMAQAQELDGEFVDLGLSVKWSTHNQYQSAKTRYGNYYNWSRATNARTSTGARIPSKAEWQELIDNCIWRWTFQDGVSGYLLTSKVKGYKGNSIFIPAAGYWKDDHVEDLSSFGRYWTSTPVTSPDCQTAYSIYFQEGNIRWKADKKEYGNSIRMVMPLSVREVAGISFEKSRYTMQQHTLARLNVTVSEEARNVNSACRWTSADESVARVTDDGLIVAVGPGRCIVRAEAFGKRAECTVSVIKHDVEFVDMGLDVLWATSNIGADKPSDYGDFFAWAEIEPKETYLRGNYRYASYVNPYSEVNTKYNQESVGYPIYDFEDDTVIYPSVTLEPSDDVASVLSGGEWRMPTSRDFRELADNSRQDTVAVNGVNGILFTSTVPGYEGNSIFIPFGGMMDRDEPVGRGERGLIWTSNLSENDADYAISAGIGPKDEHRHLGLPVRPVKGAKGDGSIWPPF